MEITLAIICTLCNTSLTMNLQDIRKGNQSTVRIPRGKFSKLWNWQMRAIRKERPTGSIRVLILDGMTGVVLKAVSRKRMGRAIPTVRACPHQEWDKSYRVGSSSITWTQVLYNGDVKNHRVPFSVIDAHIPSL